MGAAAAMSLVDQKLDQASRAMRELGLDAWLTFVRETTGGGDAVLPLILDCGLTWQSALLVTGQGQRIAIVGSHDADAVQAAGGWRDVRPYVQSIRGPLLQALRTIDPRQIAVNYAVDDPRADGLTHGLFLLLGEYLGATPYVDRLVSAAELIRTVRGRKCPAELERIEAAIVTTQEIMDMTSRWARPGTSETEVMRFMHEQCDRRGVEPAWDRNQCPIVSTGPRSMSGHGTPSPALRLEPGRIFHLDFGVRQDGYCSDLQRAWYVLQPGESQAPAEVCRAFEVVRRAIDAAFAVTRPGVEGWTIDEAARRIVTEAGYPAYDHATGHQVGRCAHDGGAVLGPRWQRYGSTPMIPLECDQVFTLELGISDVDGRGYLGVEDMVRVTSAGCRWLSQPQRSLMLLGS